MKKGLGSIPKTLAWIDNEIALPDEPIQASIQDHEEEVNASQQGLQYGLTRATFIIKKEYARKLKAYAYWERLTVKEIMEEMLADFFKDKKVRNIPKKPL